MCVQSKDGFMGLYEGWDVVFICMLIIKLTKIVRESCKFLFYHALYQIYFLLFCVALN